MRRRRLDPFDKRSMALSAAFHAVILAAGWASTFYEPPMIAFETYEIELVSPPPAVQAETTTPATEEIVVERPDPEPTPPQPEVEDVVPVEEPDPDPEPPPEEPEEQPEETTPEVAEEAAVATAPTEAPEEEPEVTGEDLNVRIEGLRRDYPAYYENIIRQVQRCLRWRRGGSWETVVFFYIRRDGTVDGIRIDERSGSSAFDFEAMGAVECAGGRFGPLPDELPFDRFPVRFRFRPLNAPLELLQPGAPAPGADISAVDVGEFAITIEPEHGVQESS